MSTLTLVRWTERSKPSPWCLLEARYRFGVVHHMRCGLQRYASQHMEKLRAAPVDLRFVRDLCEECFPERANV